MGSNLVETIIRRYNKTLAAGAIETIEVYGDFVFLKSNSGADDTLKISFDNNSETIIPVGVILKLNNSYQRIILKNTDVVSSTFVLLSGQGQIDYKALVLSGTIVTGPAQSATGTFAADVATGAAAKVFATTTTKSILIYADLANTAPVFLGFDNTVSATKKIVAMNPGATYEFTNFMGDVWAFSAAAQTISVSNW